MQAKSLWEANWSSSFGSRVLLVCLNLSLALTCLDCFLACSSLDSFFWVFLPTIIKKRTETDVGAVVGGVPRFERSSIDLHDAVLDECFSSNELIVGGIVNNVKDSCFLGDGFGGPVEVSFLQPESSVLIVATSDSDGSDSGFVGELGVGDGSGLLVGSLLLVDGHPTTCKSSLVPRVSADSHK